MKRRTKHKGMTLMECVVSIAVYALMASLLVEIMTAVNGTIKATSHLNRRLAYEAKYADNLITSHDNGSGTSVDFPSVNSSVGIKFTSPKGTFNLSATGQTYTAQYNDPDYVSNTNYRFAVFDKEHSSTEVPKGPFWITIKLDKYKYNSVTKKYEPDTSWSGTFPQITKIEISDGTTEFFPQSMLSDGMADYDDSTKVIKSEELTVDYNGAAFTTTRGANLIRIPVFVPKGLDGKYAQLGSRTLHLKFYKNMTGSLGGIYNNELFMDATLEFCDYAVSASGTKNYYREAVYVFDGESFKVIT